MQTRTRKIQAMDAEGLGRFQILHDIGVRGSGMVSMVKEKKSGAMLALKTINVKYLSKEDQKSAECEVEFL